MPIPTTSVVEQISAAMSAKALQHDVIASNIANRDAQGYQRMKVRFDSLMGEGGPPTVTVDTTPGVPSLEADVVALTRNTGQYSAMARVLSRYFSIISAITHNGRG
jgi:flagellar basal body rod protein FlgB